MFRLVMTMGIVQVEQNRLKQQEIEVKALIALMNQEVIISMRIDAVRKLHQIAFPEALAAKINQETLEDNYKQRPKRNYWGEKE